MPNLQTIREYQPLDPYHHVIDNGPILDIKTNLELINNVLDTTSSLLTDALGTQPTLKARLSVSLNDDGTLKSSAVDAALHSIEEHEDTDDYVRMTSAERDKLDDIASGATDVELTFDEEGVTYDSGTVVFNDSDSVLWRVESEGVYADVAFPLTARHRHYYDIKPIPLDPENPDYQNYTSTSVPTAYAEGSLRVYVNGVRISKLDADANPPDDVKFPRASSGSATWVSLYYEEDTATDGIVTSGEFSLSTAILSTDRITIDFDVVLT